ncbi:uncharacterized protein LOC108210947 [Daucus carota subsp. sativus]|uniref:uncharacterized protein LOC108210947 n=1 Tax=Daucus carota subsp. sativus TaxID=79200 RepID=UPI0007F01934|nr:PREDICTED: carnosine N-methyltransferase-like [Daucus carota subsp. sativus]
MSNSEEDRRRKYEEALEIKSLRRIISAFLNYPEAAEEDLKRYERSFRRLSQADKALLSHLPEKYQRMRRCISRNTFFIFEMLKAFDPPLDISQDPDICKQDPQNVSNNTKETNHCSCVPASSRKEFHPEGGEASVGGGGSIISKFTKTTSPPPDWLDPSLQMRVPLVDVDKVRCIIRNIVRDWAAEGQKERDQCYKPILEELELQFPNRSKESPPSCLVPGAGLGRLALDISCLGFASQGNEFSYYMMICSSFILNQTERANEWTIHPWIHSNCNSLSDNDQLRPILIPDIHPASAGITEGFSMCGGDFVEVYGDASQVGAWDAVVTCFFLDTAHNITRYIEIISRILRDGGVWINLGPLLYHFADLYSQDDEMSIELSLEDVKKVAVHYGFQLEKEKTIETTYTANPRSMMQNRYYTAFWTMRKGATANLLP